MIAAQVSVVHVAATAADAVSAHAASAVDAACASLFIFNRESGELLARHPGNRTGFRARPRASGSAAGAIALCAATGRSVNVQDVERDTRFSRDADVLPAGASDGSGASTRGLVAPASSLLCIPVLVRLGSVAGLEGVSLDDDDGGASTASALVTPRRGGPSNGGGDRPPRTVAGVLAFADAGAGAFDGTAERVAFLVAQVSAHGGRAHAPSQCVVLTRMWRE